MPTHPIASRLLPLSQLRPNPDQPRKAFDPQDLADLKASIQERGLINPISVREGTDGTYLIIAGERRFRAVSELGWQEVDARIWPQDTPAHEIELLSLVENLQRQDLNPLEVANGYKLLTQPPYNLTQEQIAEQVGKSRSVIGNYMVISQLPPLIQAKIDDRSSKNLGLAHYLQICRLITPEDRIAAVQEAAKKNLSVKELKSWVDRKLAAQPTPQQNIPQKPMDDVSWSGQEIKIHRSFKPQKETKDAYLAWLAQALDLVLAHPPTPKPKEMPATVPKLPEGLSDENRRAAELWLPKTPEEMEEFMQSSKNVRIPKTTEEWAKVEERAKVGGPGAVYAWAQGENSYFAKKARDKTWQDLGVADPISGCHKIIEALRLGLEDQH